MAGRKLLQGPNDVGDSGRTWERLCFGALGVGGAVWAVVEHEGLKALNDQGFQPGGTLFGDLLQSCLGAHNYVC